MGFFLTSTVVTFSAMIPDVSIYGSTAFFFEKVIDFESVGPLLMLLRSLLILSCFLGLRIYGCKDLSTFIFAFFFSMVLVLVFGVDFFGVGVPLEPAMCFLLFIVIILNSYLIKYEIIYLFSGLKSKF